MDLERLCETESLAISEPSPAKGRLLDRVINQSTAPPYEKVNRINFSCLSQKYKFLPQLNRDNLV